MEYYGNKGIYGIYIDGELIYIGLTNNCFGERFHQHRYNLIHKSRWKGQEKLYSAMFDGVKEKKQVELVPLVIKEELERENNIVLDKRDLAAMELAFISYWRMTGNLKNLIGVDKSYIITERDIIMWDELELWEDYLKKIKN